MRDAGVTISGGRCDGFVSVGDVAEMAALFEIPVEGIEHTDYSVTAEAEDVLDFSAFKVVDYEVSYEFFAHARKYLP